MSRILPLYLIIILCFCNFSNHTYAQVVSTYAGDTTNGYSGDNHSAAHAQLMQPYGIAVDQKNNLYIADHAANCIRKVDSTGIITTFAGTGVAGFSGDSSLATAALLNGPTSVAADRFGNVYIADNGNFRLRKVDTNGIITTIFYDYVYMTIPLTVAVNQQGRVYFTALNYFYYFIDSVDVLTLEDTTGTPIWMQEPNGITFDSVGNMYVAVSTGSTGNIVKVDTFGHCTNLAGDGSCGSGCYDSVNALSVGLYGFTGIARDDSGNIYACESTSSRIVKVNRFGFLTTYAGTCYYGGHTGDGGYALSAYIDVGETYDNYNPLAIDKAGNIYMAEVDYHDIRKITPGGIATTSVIKSSAIAINTNLSISPNPNNGDCAIFLSSPVEEQAQITVTNMLGERIKEFSLHTNSSMKANFDFSPGVYILSASASTGKYNTKFTIR